MQHPFRVTVAKHINKIQVFQISKKHFKNKLHSTRISSFSIQTLHSNTINQLLQAIQKQNNIII